MISAHCFDANIVLAHNDLATTGWAVHPQRAMDAVEHAIAALPEVAGIEITYLGTRAPTGPRITVRLLCSNSLSRATDDRAAALERRITQVTYRALANLTGRIMHHAGSRAA